jgi:hypothetical protein
MLACVGWVAGAQAFWLDSFFNHVETGRRANAQWPAPYVCPDRAHVRAPFEQMVQNGWRRQNLMAPYHFKEDGATLTTAGELKVRWILTQAPPQHRQIFVERAFNPTETAKRMEAVQQFAGLIAMGDQPMVTETDMIAEGRPASVVDAIGVRFLESMPPPVLPAAESGTTGQQ